MYGTFWLVESLKPSPTSRWISSHGGVLIIWISSFSSALTRVAGSCSGRKMTRSSLALAAPVIGVALQHRLDALIALDEAERPGADRVQRDAVVAVFLHRGRADHQRLAVALQTLAQPLVVRRRQGYPHRHRVDDVDALDPFCVGDDEGFRLLVEVRASSRPRTARS